MKYRTKLKLKLFWFRVLGMLSLIVPLIFAYIGDKLLETILAMVFAYIFRPMYSKQWHSKSLYRCSVISAIVFIIMSRITLSIGESIFITIVLTFVLTNGSYLLRDILDKTILLETYKKKLEKFEHKVLENLTEDEMCETLPHIPYEVLHIVYGYLHKPKTISSTAYAMKHYVSEATLFRYLKRVRTAYEDLE